MDDSERFGKVTRIFTAALDMAPATRAEFIARACGDDAELRAEVESLLQHDALAGPDFLVPPLATVGMSAEDISGWAQRLVVRSP